MERVRVRAPYLGGAFGGKDDITVQCLIGLAALNADGTPVKMWWDRAESFLAGVKRLPARMYYRLGAKNDGTFLGLISRLYYDGGAYAGLSGEIMAMGTEHAGSAYLIPNGSVEGRCMYTNNPPGGPFRGFGVPQVTFAMEQAVDMIAEKLSMDPLEVRRKNAFKAGDVNCLGVELNWICRLEKGEFLGRDVLVRQKAEGVTRRLAGFETEGRAVARHGFLAVRDGRVVGHMTSGCFSPVFKKNIGLAYLPMDLQEPGQRFEVEIRGRREPAVVVPTPFYKRAR